MTQSTMSAYYALASLGLCALMGYAGQISLGQAGFFAIGGYASSFIATRNLEAIASTPIVKALDLAGLLTRGADPYGAALLSLNPWIACLGAILLAAGIAALIGTPVLRLKGHYLAMATLGFGLVIERIVRGTKAFGGADGLSNVPAFPLLPGFVVTGGRAARAANFTISWVVLALGLLLSRQPRRLARRPRSARPPRRRGSGRRDGRRHRKYKLNVFVLGAVYAAVAGVLLTHYNGSIGPGEANVLKSVRYVAIVAVGGMANLTGTSSRGWPSISCRCAACSAATTTRSSASCSSSSCSSRLTAGLSWPRRAPHWPHARPLAAAASITAVAKVRADAPLEVTALSARSAASGRSTD